MSFLSNTKAQMNKIYTGAKQTPVAKGIKGILYEEGLKKNSQTKILNEIYSENKRRVDIMSSLYDDGRKYAKSAVGADGGDTGAIVNASMNKIEKLGMDSIEEGQFKSFLNGRFKDDKEVLELQNKAIINKAKYASVKDGDNLKVIDDKKAKSIIEETAMQVDGQLAFMTPISMAKEYYGAPVINAMDNFSNKEYIDAIKDVGITGARVGATVGATVGAGTIVGGGVNLTATAFDRLKNNNNYGG